MKGGKVINFQIKKGNENTGGHNVVGELLFFRWLEPPTYPTPLGWKALSYFYGYLEIPEITAQNLQTQSA